MSANLLAMSDGTTGRLTADERRQSILAVARELFAARGLDGVTTREVAEAADVSEALLYRHFASKAALYLAVQGACIQSVADNAALLEAAPDTTATLVLAIYLVMLDIQRPRAGSQTGEVARLLLQSLLDDGKFAREFIQQAAGHWVDRLTRCVRAAIKSGDLVTEAQESIVGVWFSHHLANAIVFHRMPPTPVVSYGIANWEQLFEFSVRFALRGIGLTPGAIQRYYKPEEFKRFLTAPAASRAGRKPAAKRPT